jgi:transcription termination/antitermination protein NusA
MISKEFFKNIEAVAEEKELTHEQVLKHLVQGMIAGCKKAHDVRSCRVEIKEEKSEILVLNNIWLLKSIQLMLIKTIRKCY